MSFYFSAKLAKSENVSAPKDSLLLTQEEDARSLWKAIDSKHLCLQTHDDEDLPAYWEDAIEEIDNSMASGYDNSKDRKL
ncbi:hypothetical protein Tco_0894485 [Tanacetum coccineum]|uniref:Uncharacterized protein n=1 Tax=Tanacetum coccineum TaxID=301880 RepID=A0ABQ5CD62_9ASTR